MENEATVLTVYAREGCHLCERMIEELQCCQDEAAFVLEVVDVDCDDGLRRRFGLSVPVLMAGEVELCRHFFNYAAVNAYLGNIR